LFTTFRNAVFLSIFLQAAAAAAQGGPPLITDDTETVPKGRWELNLAWFSEFDSKQWRHEFPTFDLNYGISDRQHINVSVPWVFVSTNGERLDGIGSAEVGTKWRFLENKAARPALSIHPAIEFAFSSRSNRLGLTDPGTSAVLPMELQWEFHNLGVNADVGIGLSPGSLPSWLMGVAVGTNALGCELLAEIHGDGLEDGSESVWIAQIGLRREFSESASLLFAAGKSFASHGADPVRWTSYFAMQFRF